MPSSTIRKIGGEALAALGNCVVFFVAFIVGLRVVYGFVFSVLGLGVVGPGLRPPVSEQQAMVFSISVAFLCFAGLTTVWTRHVLNVVATSAAVFLVGMILIAQAMYLADGGDQALIWRYIKPGAAEITGAVITAGAAGLGWYFVTLLRRSRRVRAWIGAAVER